MKPDTKHDSKHDSKPGTGTAVTFSDLVDLASARLGGRTLYATDDFFAEKENLLQPGRGIFLPDEYTDRGKWMDGWESRRKRGPGYDSCLVALGVEGRVRAVDIDTNHFLGNHPPHASVDGCRAPLDATVDQLQGRDDWFEVVGHVSLRPGSQNLFTARDARKVSHVRLNIYPDGGVARLRVYGDVLVESFRRDDAGRVDLVAVENGGRALACNDKFFSSMDNLIMPGRGKDMGDGWETRRKRGPGHDWVVLRLGRPGVVRKVRVDTAHFKGNFPDRCSLEGCSLEPGEVPPRWEDAPWEALLPEVPLGADAEHDFEDEIVFGKIVTHVRLNMIPDGGISRLRLFGNLKGEDHG